MKRIRARHKFEDIVAVNNAIFKPSMLSNSKTELIDKI